MAKQMKQSVQRVADALRAAGIEAEIKELSASTRTAEEAAAAIGTSVPRIVKSLVFLADDAPILALVSGSNRLDTDRLGAALGRTIARADAATVRAATGFAIGGVPPLGHATRARRPDRPRPAPVRRGLGGGRDAARRLPDPARRAGHAPPTAG